MTTPSKLDLLAAGRLSQMCPDCGIAEAAHAYCSACLRPMGPDDWRAAPASEKRREALRHAHEAKRASAMARSRQAGFQG